MSIKRVLYKSIVGKPLRSFALLFICIVMSAAVYGGAVISVSLQNGIDSLEQRLGADIIVLPESASEKVKLENILLQGTPGYFYMDKDIANKLAAINGVDKLSAQYFLVSANAECCTVQVQIIGFDEDTDFSVKPWLREAYSGKLGKNEIVVGSDLSTRVGHSLTLYGVECKAVGKLETSISIPDGVASIGDYAFRDCTSLSSVVISGSVRLLITAVWLLSAVIMLIVFTVLINERKREFAVLRAVGFSRRRLAAQVLLGSLVICFVGAVLGIGICTAVVFPFSRLIERKAGLPLLTPDALTAAGYAFAALAAVTVTGPLASAYSAYRLSRIDTGRILREGD